MCTKCGQPLRQNLSNRNFCLFTRIRAEAFMTTSVFVLARLETRWQQKKLMKHGVQGQNISDRNYQAIQRSRSG